MILETKNLTYRYEPERPVVRNVDLGLETGKLVGIIGPNGSGKSTVMRLLTGLLAPNSGDILLKGKPLAQYSRLEIAREIAFLPQVVSPTFGYSVEEIVAQGRFPYLGGLGVLSSEDRRVVADCMERMEVGEFASRPLHTLSGGEHQRALLASVLAQQTNVLLLDEPTSALDIHHQAAIFRLLRNLTAQSKLAVGIVVHDLNAAARFCDRLILLSQGEAIAQGSPEHVILEKHLRPVYHENIVVDSHPRTRRPLITILESDDDFADVCENTGATQC